MGIKKKHLLDCILLSTEIRHFVFRCGKKTEEHMAVLVFLCNVCLCLCPVVLMWKCCYKSKHTGYKTYITIINILLLVLCRLRSLQALLLLQLLTEYTHAFIWFLSGRKRNHPDLLTDFRLSRWCWVCSLKLHCICIFLRACVLLLMALTHHHNQLH